MKKYNTSHKYLHQLNPLGKQLYYKFLANVNKSKQRQQLLTRQELKNTLHYALSSISDSLQLLRNKGIIFFNKITRSWMLILQNHDSIDIYDNYIKFKWDWPNFIPLDEWIKQQE